MSSISSATTRRTARRVRQLVILAVLALSTTLGLLHATKTAPFVPVGVDALCPFGGLETLWSFVTQDVLLKRIAFSSLVMLLATFAVALVMGRAFCGQLCPLGTLQEIAGRIGRRLGIARRNPPARIDGPARWMKYAVLAISGVGTWVAGSLIFRPLDPWAAYHHLTSAELFTEFSLGAAVLALTVGGSLVYERFFCRYACPMGALLGLLARFSRFRVRRVAEPCTDCGSCDRACPVGIDVARVTAVSSAECIACGECVTACARPGALAFADGRGRTVPPLLVTVVTAGVFFGVVGIATAADLFDWSQPTVAGEMQRAQESGSQVFDTTVIKGSTTLSEIVAGTGIPASELTAALGVPESEFGVPLKDIKAVYGFTMNDVRTLVATYLGSEPPPAEEH